MAIIEDLRDWRGRDVLAADGDKVGKLVDVYFDVESDQPLFLVVETGRKGPFVLAPAWNAATSPEHITLAYQPAALERAPTVDPGRGLSVEEEQKLFAYYKVDYQPSNTGSRRRLIRR
jgi:sporulation protein YlmC with PRC-barrel domain